MNQNRTKTPDNANFFILLAAGASFFFIWHILVDPQLLTGITAGGQISASYPRFLALALENNLFIPVAFIAVSVVVIGISLLSFKREAGRESRSIIRAIASPYLLIAGLLGFGVDFGARILVMYIALSHHSHGTTGFIEAMNRTFSGNDHIWLLILTGAGGAVAAIFLASFFNTLPGTYWHKITACFGTWGLLMSVELLLAGMIPGAVLYMTALAVPAAAYVYFSLSRNFAGERDGNILWTAGFTILYVVATGALFRTVLLLGLIQSD